MAWCAVLLLTLQILGQTSGVYYGKLLGSFSPDAHDLRGTLYAVDERRILIKDFNYDGLGPDAYFWVGRKDTTNSNEPNAEGTIIPNEKGNKDILRAYSSKTIVLDMVDLTLQDIRWISVWCRDFSANFGWLSITNDMTSSLPAPRRISRFSQLAHGLSSGDVTIMDANTIMIKDIRYDGYGPDAYFIAGTGNPTTAGTRVPDENGSSDIVKGYNGKDIELHLPDGLTFYDVDYLSLYCIQFTQNFGDVRFNNIPAESIPPDVEQFVYKPSRNCETLSENKLNVGWEISGGNVIIELTAAIDSNDYIAFGVSGNPNQFYMSNGDVTVVYNHNGVAKAIDYHMNAYSLCSGRTGVCPDAASGGTNDVTFLSYQHLNGVTIAKYSRPLLSNDNGKDSNILSTSATQIIWALGGINDQEQVTKHHTRITANKRIQFYREVADNCKTVRAPETKKDVKPWPGHSLSAQDVKVFAAELGPTGGDQGYKAITGKQSWGIAWYINGILIPEITVRRGDNVKFRVHGGQQPSNAARYHPFYITDDPVGGFANKNATERRGVRIFAGHGGPNVVGQSVGQYCEYAAAGLVDPDLYETFEEFRKNLIRICDSGSPGEFTWHVTMDTPDTVYYQCYTHNFLGWKINVVDEYASSSSTVHLNIFMQCVLLFIAFISKITF